MTEKKENDAINLTIKIHAPIEDLWKAWTHPTLVLKWFGSDPKGVGLDARLNVQVGGIYEISFRGSDGIAHTCYGVYREVKEFRKLVFSWTWKSEPGVESLVTIHLLREGENTFMQFEHAHVGNKSMHNYLAGWQAAFDKLDRMLNSA